ncbi:MAG: hypothetical protein N3B01_10220 [Verrucomicrobiae bacterium]|nr:hypothetical protein [Verrucomicrobiae bacterium]
MKYLLKSVLTIPLLPLCLQAQISVQLQAEKDFYLLYESIPLIVTLHNLSGRTLQLEPDNGRPWLSFEVQELSGAAVPPTGRIHLAESVLIPPAQTALRTVDILPLFELRARGNYRVRAVVTLGAEMFISPTLKFSIIHGRELWSQTVGLPSIGDGRDEYRPYSLLAHRTQRDDRLYLSVKDDNNQIVYGVLPLGTFLPVYQPMIQVDRDAHAHVLFQNGPRSFAYVEVNPRAKILQRAAFSDYMSRPRLVNDKGIVTVSGGEQVYPKLERILAESEWNPPPQPPPQQEKKKKSFWPFGKKEEKPMGDELPRTTR